MPSPIARLDRVTLRYGDTVALDSVSFEVAEGERVCVLGANGSGKSTLASVLAGLLAPDDGSVELAGETCVRAGAVDFEAYRCARRRLGLMFQNPDDQLVTTVVEEDVAFGPENLGVPASEIGARVARELDRVAMTAYAQADPTKLSGGQKQRVCIAGALAMEPALLVLDEPGALLDVRGRAAICRVMGRLRGAGTAVVHVTHFMDESLDADRVVVLDHGRVALEGTPAEVFAHGERLAGLGLEEPFAGQLATELRERGVPVAWTVDEDALAAEVSDEALREDAREGWDGSRCAGRSSHEELSASRESTYGAGTPIAPATVLPASSPTLALAAEHVRYSYEHGSGSRPALDDVTFAIAPGQWVAIIGQTGSGKSTLLRLLCALEVPDAGRVTVGGVDTARKRDRRTLHGRIGYVMQHPERQLFAETVALDVGYGPHNLGLTDAEVDARVAHALELVGLAAKASASPFELSGGQQRLAAIAGILAMEPATLVLDEPTAGLDPRGRTQLRRILATVRERGTTLVEVTHSMDNAALADRVIVLDRSRVLLDDTPAQVFTAANEPQLTAAGLGLPASVCFARRIGLASEPLTLAALADAIAESLPRAGGGGDA